MNNRFQTIGRAFVTASAIVVLATSVVRADQQNKNLWRNLGIGGAVVAGHGLLTHNSTETIIGAAGAAYSANRYEQDRRNQSKQRQVSLDQRARQLNARYGNRSRRYYVASGHIYRLNRRTGERVQVG